MNAIQAHRRGQARTGLVFAALVTTFWMAYYFPFERGGWAPRLYAGYLTLHARMAGVAIAWIDPTARAAGHAIVGRFAMAISSSCDATQMILLFAAAVLAFPARWQERVSGIVIGTAAIIVVNVFRLCTLYYLGETWPSAFEYAHRELWPLLLIGFVLVTFLVWAGATRAPSESRRPDALS